MSISLEQLESGEADRYSKPSRQELRGYLHALRSGWRIIVPIVVVTVAVAWYSMRSRVPVYTAEVLVQLTEASTATAIGGMRLSEPVDYASQVEIIRSRAVLSAPVDSLAFQLNLGIRSPDRSEIILEAEVRGNDAAGSYLLASTGAGASLSDPNTEEEITRAVRGSWLEIPGMRLRVDDREIGPEPIRISVSDSERAVERLQGRLMVEPGLGPALIRIRYQDPDPAYAAAVANTTARAYEDFRAAAARQAAATRKDFYAGRLVEMTDSLQRVQQHLLDYQQSQGSLDPQMEGSALMATLMQAENDVRVLRYQVGMLEALTQSLNSGSTAPGDMHQLVALGDNVLPGGSAMYSRLQELNAERASLTSARYGQTVRGPEVELADSLLAATWRDVRALATTALEVRRGEIEQKERYIQELRNSVGAVPERSAEFTRLGQQVGTVQSIFDNLLSGYYEALIAEAVQTGDVRIVDAAAVPLYPSEENVPFNLALAAVLGLMLGAGGVVVRHHFDNRVRAADEAERSADLQTLGMIPHFSGSGRTELQSAGVEAFRWLATNLNFVDSAGPLVVAVTSAAPGEGKSTVAVNLALSSAAAGRRVLLLDSDFRRPIVHGLLKAQRGPGLSDVLKGDAHPVAAIRAVEAWGIDVMTCGSAVEDPTRLVAGDVLPDLLSRLRRHYDMVIIDTAPVLAVAESMVVCTSADGVLFAVRANQTDRRAVFEATTKLRRLSGKLLGLVLTDVPTGSTYDRESYRYYDYGYYESGDNGKRARFPAKLVGGGKRG